MSKEKIKDKLRKSGLLDLSKVVVFLDEEEVKKEETKENDKEKENK